jgi:hypothetical protein
MKIKVRNNAGNWEELRCDGCGGNEWEAIPERVAFECQCCDEPGPIVKDGEWEEIAVTLDTYEDLEECIAEYAHSGFETVPEYFGWLPDETTDRTEAMKDWFRFCANHAIANFDGPLRIIFCEGGCEIGRIPA